MEYLQFINGFKEIQNRLQNEFPYSINIIDELHADENAHTRIFLQLLRYRVNNTYVILQKIIEVLNGYLSEYKIDLNDLSKAQILDQYRNIDGLIYLENKFAIIIENKIQWAKDQDKQIENYTEYVKGKHLEDKQIYVVYLTDNGIKKVADYSLTEAAKKTLDVSDNNNGRFIELNYRDNILPLLQDVLSCLEFSQEVYLKSTVIQYIDYLEGRFGQRVRERKYNELFKKELLKMFEIDTSKLVTITDRFEAEKKIRDKCNQFLEELNKDPQNKENLYVVKKQIEYMLSSIYPKTERPNTTRDQLLKFLKTDLNIEPHIDWNRYPDWIGISLEDRTINKTCTIDIGFVDTTKILIRIKPNNNQKLRDYLSANQYEKDPDNKEKMKLELPYEEHYRFINERIECLLENIQPFLR